MASHIPVFPYGGLSSVSAEVDEFRCLFDLETCDRSSGDDFPFSPDMKYSLMGEYVWGLDNIETYLNGSHVFTDEKLAGAPGATPETNPEALLPDYGIINTSLALTTMTIVFH